jgi:hypothetical protein
VNAGAPGRARSRTAALGLLLATLACKAPDPKALFEVSDVDAYWAVEPPMGGEQYIAPVVRFRLTNRSGREQHSVQTMATFRRQGEENLSWGSAFEQVVSRRNPLAPGQSVLVTLKSDARYHSSSLEGMFTHPQFRDATVEFFVRVGSSGWVSFGKAPIERRFGPRSVASPSPPAAVPTPSTPAAPSPARPH